jgi:hypothetical protein
MFWLWRVCDEFFVPALENVSSTNMNLSWTWRNYIQQLAPKGSARNYLQSLWNFYRGEIGFGTIIGSAVFNDSLYCPLHLFQELLGLTWVPLFRDSFCLHYCLGAGDLCGRLLGDRLVGSLRSPFHVLSLHCHHVQNAAIYKYFDGKGTRVPNQMPMTERLRHRQCYRRTQRQQYDVTVALRKLKFPAPGPLAWLQPSFLEREQALEA